MIWDLIKEDGLLVSRNQGEWVEATECLREHGLLGAVYQKHSDSLPEFIKHVYYEAYRRQLGSNLYYESLLKTLFSDPRAQNLNVTVLKGMSLLKRLYTDRGTRNMADVDLLVAPEDLKSTIELFYAHGYRQVLSPKWERNQFKTLFHKENETGEWVFELHLKLFYQEKSRFSWALEPFEKENEWVGNLSSLKKEDQFVHLVGHLAEQHTFLKLSWLVDLDRWLRKHADKMDWDRVQFLCESLRLTRSLDASFYALSTHLETPIPRAFGSVWSPLLTSEFLISPKSERLRYFTLKHLLKNSMVDSILYDYQWAKKELKFGNFKMTEKLLDRFW